MADYYIIPYNYIYSCETIGTYSKISNTKTNATKKTVQKNQAISEEQKYTFNQKNDAGEIVSTFETFGANEVFEIETYQDGTADVSTKQALAFRINENVAIKPIYQDGYWILEGVSLKIGKSIYRKAVDDIFNPIILEKDNLRFVDYNETERIAYLSYTHVLDNVSATLLELTFSLVGNTIAESQSETITYSDTGFPVEIPQNDWFSVYENNSVFYKLSQEIISYYNKPKRLVKLVCNHARFKRISEDMVRDDMVLDRGTWTPASGYQIVRKSNSKDFYAYDFKNIIVEPLGGQLIYGQEIFVEDMEVVDEHTIIVRNLPLNYDIAEQPSSEIYLSYSIKFNSETSLPTELTSISNGNLVIPYKSQGVPYYTDNEGKPAKFKVIGMHKIYDGTLTQELILQEI